MAAKKRKKAGRGDGGPEVIGPEEMQQLAMAAAVKGGAEVLKTILDFYPRHVAALEKMANAQEKLAAALPPDSIGNIAEAFERIAEAIVGQMKLDAERFELQKSTQAPGTG